MFWNRDIHLKRTKFTKKLALIQVRQWMPALGIVHGGFGVPLGYLVLISDMAHSRKIARNTDPKRGFQTKGSSR